MYFPKTILCVIAPTITIVYAAAITTTTATAPSKWVHPGVMLSRSQLNFVRQKVHRHEQPWAAAYDALVNDENIANPKEPSPHVIVECGPYSNPDVGCTVERNDSIAAYGNALVWAISGQNEYAQRAIKIMDAYSSTIKGHNNTNAPLQSGWVGSIWARAGELIRYTDAGWPEDNIKQFGAMLKNVYMPLTVNGTDHNVANWELGMKPPAVRSDKIANTMSISHDRSRNLHGGLLGRRRIIQYRYGMVLKTSPSNGLHEK